ncbi:MAG: prephenate dehydrogenase [Thermoguttaceae bacterium]
MLSRVLIVGVGLLGTSLGLALKQRSLARTVCGVDPLQEHLDLALERGAIDCGMTELSSFSPCSSPLPLSPSPQNHRPSPVSFQEPDELVVVCTPVRLIAPTILAFARENNRRPRFITDVGSTKLSILREIKDRLPPHLHYVGSHPITGSEQSGPSSARADLFAGTLTVLTPCEDQPIGDTAFLERFWNALGSTVIQTPPDIHDQILSRTSHFPHLLATLLVQMLKPGDHLMVGPGFRSTSRLASGNVSIWRDIFMDNREEVLQSINQFRSLLDLCQEILEQGDEYRLEKLLGQSKRQRDALERK